MADGATPDNGAPREQLGLPSTMTNPRLEFAMEVTLEFTRVQNIEDMPQGFGRGAVYLDGGSFQGPKLRGRAVPDSGGDYAMFRPDDVLSFDARYLLEEDDGTMIVIYNAGYLWGRQPDTMAKIREWIFNNGPEVPHSEYYLRAFPRFEVQSGKHDWLMRHVFIGVGERLQHGNRFRYYALT
ncbi:MAG: DUF3237 domain-containing protein [Gammaproteobacteria bacterium]|nr:DUF3237 domain-containing protein [Gammaproteobacteria bacterium]